MFGLGNPPSTSVTPPRQPFVPLLLAALAGIVADECARPAVEWWLLLAAASVVATLGLLCASRSQWLLTATILLATGAVAAAWHERCARRVASDDVCRLLSEERQLCRLRGRLLTTPVIDKPAPPTPLVWRVERHSRFRLAADEWITARGSTPVAGKVMIQIDGVCKDLHVDDRVELTGWIGRPQSPSNPGEFDYSTFLANQGIRAELHAEAPAAVELLARPGWWSPRRWRDEAVRRAGSTFQAYLPAREAALAEALLLGTKAAMSRDELEPFLNSGTLHLLVVSGWHVAFLAYLVWNIGNLLFLSWSSRALLTIAAVWLYTFVTGGDPPAVRAAVLATALFSGYVVRRPIQPLNSWSASGLFVLALDPTQLFRVGTQLSFLAVLALMIVSSRFRVDLWWPQPFPFLDERWWTSFLKGVARSFVSAMVVSAVVWVLVSPLVAQQFHLFSPVGIPLTAVLIYPVCAAIVMSMMLLILAPCPALAQPFGWLSHWPLWIMSEAVAFFEKFPAAYCYTAGPPAWWVIGFFALVFLPWCWPGYRRFHIAHAAMAVVWMVVGVADSLLQRPPADLEFHQLAVGHGNAGVLRFPSGQTVLVDCGSMAGPRVGERSIAPWLWHHRVGAIDAVFLSHADVDHFNGLVGLMKRFPIRKVYCPPQFARLTQPAVDLLYRELARHGIPFEFDWAEDRFNVGDTKLDVLLPRAFDRSRSDNADSLVLACRHRGRTILMPGDLEREGMARLLEFPRRGNDVLVAPHHGSPLSNTPDLAAWAGARLLISSQGRPRSPRDPLAIYLGFGTRVLRNDRDGAVAVRWRGDTLHISTHRSRVEFALPAD